MVEEVGGIRYHHFHRNHTWIGKCPMGSGRLYMGTKQQNGRCPTVKKQLLLTQGQGQGQGRDSTPL